MRPKRRVSSDSGSTFCSILESNLNEHAAAAAEDPDFTVNIKNDVETVVFRKSQRIQNKPKPDYTQPKIKLTKRGRGRPKIDKKVRLKKEIQNDNVILSNLLTLQNSMLKCKEYLCDSIFYHTTEQQLYFRSINLTLNDITKICVDFSIKKEQPQIENVDERFKKINQSLATLGVNIKKMNVPEKRRSKKLDKDQEIITKNLYVNNTMDQHLTITKDFIKNLTNINKPFCCFQTKNKFICNGNHNSADGNTIEELTKFNVNSATCTNFENPKMLINMDNPKMFTNMENSGICGIVKNPEAWKNLGNLQICKNVANSQTYKKLGNSQICKNVKNSQMCKNVGNLQTDKNLDNSQTCENVENSQTNKYLGNLQIRTSMENLDNVSHLWNNTLTTKSYENFLENTQNFCNNALQNDDLMVPMSQDLFFSPPISQNSIINEETSKSEIGKNITSEKPIMHNSTSKALEVNQFQNTKIKRNNTSISRAESVYYDVSQESQTQTRLNSLDQSNCSFKISGTIMSQDKDTNKILLSNSSGNIHESQTFVEPTPKNLKFAKSNIEVILDVGNKFKENTIAETKIANMKPIVKYSKEENITKNMQQVVDRINDNKKRNNNDYNWIKSIKNIKVKSPDDKFKQNIVLSEEFWKDPYAEIPKDWLSDFD